MKTRFPLSLESLGDRLNLSPLIPTEQTRQITVVQDLSPPGDQALVFFLGGIPSSDATPTGYVFGTELPQDANRHVRHRMFAIVDRTGAADPSQERVGPFFEFKSSRLGDADDAESRRRNLVTLLSMDLERPGQGTDQIQSALLIAKQRPM